MKTDKQAVEEMADNICEIQNKGMYCSFCDTGCEYRMLAEALYNAGYRKQSDNVIELPCKVGDILYVIVYLAKKGLQAEKERKE